MQITLENHLEEGKPISKEQKTYLDLIKKTFQKNKLNLIDQKLFRYNSENFKDDYELSDQEKEYDEKKLQSMIKKKTRKLKYYFDNQMKIIAKTNYENITQLVLSTYIPPSTMEVVENIWTFFYPRKLETGFIWGRYSNKSKHGGGDLFFAPIDFNIIDFLKDKGQGIVSESYINGLENLEENELLASTDYSICNLITKIRHSKLIKEELEAFKEKEKLESTGFELIDKLDANKELNLTFKKCLVTFGNKTLMNKASFQSKIDINLLAFNYKSGAIIQVSTFHSKIHHLTKVIMKLIMTLNEIN
ncbi:MAG: hypothetical protein EAX96_15440 [Candidatus Lokiarchaeota archaeon]|nr:hypothetical protein [Candidatus Lokiarchaeota archaeon]